MSIFYNLIFLIFFIFYIPIYLLKGKIHRNFLTRFGFLPTGLKLEKPIWIHAVSVGEVMAVRGLIKELRRAHPEKKIVLSTVTPTGNRIAKSIATPGDFVTYLPLDFSFIVRSVLERINPSLFIIAETEIWPNLISQLTKRKIPVIIVNGRLSNRAYAGYKKIIFFIRPILKKISLFSVQTDTDAQRFRNLGASIDKIKVTGNLKFDSVVLKIEDFVLIRYRERLCLADTDELIVCGSTHPGEEEALLEIYKELLGDHPNLKLMIAPRHPERGREIAKVISRLGFRSEFLSSPTQSCSSCIPKPIFILDVIGQLNYFYALADIVFVGGSLVKKGGHNILEPASFGKAVLFGPQMFNFREIAELFLKNKAAIQVNDTQELKNKIKELLNNEEEIKKIGQTARQLILDNSGATARTIELIKSIF